MGYLRYLRTLSYIRTVHIVGDRLGDPQSVFSLDSPRQVCLFLYPILFPIYLWIPLARTLEHIGPRGCPYIQPHDASARKKLEEDYRVTCVTEGASTSSAVKLHQIFTG